MTINCKGSLLDFSSPRVMGILNITPDSFYDGGKYPDEKALLLQTEKMLREGASIIDIGAYSSRPGATDISEDEELGRIVPIVELILGNFPSAILSVDTFRAGVARICIEAGAAMVNDISGGDLDSRMMKTVAELQVPYIMMHMRGSPQNMTKLTDYEDVLIDVRYSLSEKVARARQLKINDVIIDPGFGFAKTRSQNFSLLKHLDLFLPFDVPLLVGLSRKSMIYKTLGTDAERALNGTTALNMYALNKGAHILRVHDVKEAVECVRLFEELRDA